MDKLCHQDNRWTARETVSSQVAYEHGEVNTTWYYRQLEVTQTSCPRTTRTSSSDEARQTKNGGDFSPNKPPLDNSAASLLMPYHYG